jgi:N-acetylglucosaminyldiphosphoundecaprenol N-acetyl-beta-D-mannosaminyltransferase
VSQSTKRARLKIGRLWIDALTFDQALDQIEALVSAGGGAVFTPNIDHIVNAEADSAFREAYEAAALSLVDGKPVVWASRLLGAALPEKISGADLIAPVMRRASERGWGVYLLGGGPGVAERAAQMLQRDPGVRVVGVDSPRVAPDGACEPDVLERISRARPEILLVAFGSPKQELFIHRNSAALAPAVALAIGAGLDFIAGAVRRAPAWMSNAGLEWLYRLSREPRRLWRRYLVNDPKFALILLKTLREPRTARERRI